MTYPLRLLRLRLLRLPPTEVTLGQPFKIILSVTDDLGEHFPAYTDVNRKHFLKNCQHTVQLTVSKAQICSSQDRCRRCFEWSSPRRNTSDRIIRQGCRLFYIIPRRDIP